MLKHTFLAIFLCAAGHTAAAEWQHTNPDFDRTGQVTLKTLSGVTSQLSNSGQQGLQSSASPTVLSINSGAASLKISKIRELNYNHSNLLSGNVEPINPVTTNLGEDFDITKTFIEVIQYSAIESYVVKPNGEIGERSKDATWGFKLASPSEITAHPGWFARERLRTEFAYPRYKVRIIELATGQVEQGILQLQGPSPAAQIEVPPGAELRYSHQTGICRHPSFPEQSKVVHLWVEQVYEGGKQYLKFSSEYCPLNYGFGPVYPVIYYFIVKS